MTTPFVRPGTMVTQPSIAFRCRTGVLFAGMAWGALSGCMSGAQRPPPATTAPPRSSQSPALPVPLPPAGGARYQIDPQRTVVTVIVRRAGALARLGHDHVVTSAD